MCDFFLKQTLDTNLKPLFLIKSGYHIVPSHSTALPEMLILDVDGVGIHLAKSQEWHVLRINFEDQIEFSGTHEIAQGFVG